MPGTTDTVKTILTPGEFVIRKEAVDMVGVPMLNMINNMPEKGGHSNIDRLIEMATTANMKGMYGGGMVNAGPKPMGTGGMVDAYAGGGMVMNQYGHGGMVKKKMMGYGHGGMVKNKIMNYGHGGMVKDKMMMMEKGGQLKPVPKDNPGLGKLPEMVRNRMGYMQMGGMVDNSLMGMMGGGMAMKKKMMGMQDGGSVQRKTLLGAGADFDQSNMDRDGNIYNLRRVMSIPADQVGGGQGLRYYGGEGKSSRMNLARAKAGMDATQQMAFAPQDSIPFAMVDQFLSGEPESKGRLRQLLGFQDGGMIGPMPDPQMFADEQNRQLEQSIDQRMANPNVYRGSVLGAVRDSAMMLQDSINQDTENKALKTLELMRLKGMLDNPESIEMQAPPMPNTTMADSMRMRDLLEFAKMQSMMRGVPAVRQGMGSESMEMPR